MEFANIEESELFKNICNVAKISTNGEILSMAIDENQIILSNGETRIDKIIVLEFKSITKRIYGNCYLFTIEKNQFGLKNGSFSYTKIYAVDDKIYTEQDFNEIYDYVCEKMTESPPNSSP